LAAPRLHAADLPAGYAILEDFGDDLFVDALGNGASEEDLYRVAVEVLARIHAEQAPTELPGGFPLHVYDEVALLAETDLLTEWFLPLALGRAATDQEAGQHRQLWKETLDGIAPSPRVFVHR